MLLCPNIFASDAVRESKIISEIKRSLAHGEVLILDPDNQAFFAIYEETSLAIKQGGVIIIHGIDSNPDSPIIINPLRTQLLDSGWDTLSLQMPVSHEGSSLEKYIELIPEAFPRLDAAISFFSNENNFNLAIVAHGMGATMATDYLNQTTQNTVRALIAISMVSPQDKISQSLEKLTIPILDLYGSKDLPSVLNNAKNRKRAVILKAKNFNYRQVKIEGANHDFTGLNDALVSTVRAWLGENATGTVTKSRIK